MRCPKQLLMMVPWEEHAKVSVFIWYKSNCKTFYHLFLDNEEREENSAHMHFFFAHPCGLKGL